VKINPFSKREGRMKFFVSILIIFLLLGLFLGMIFAYASSQEKAGEKTQETVLDRKIHIEKEPIVDIPQVRRMCDRLDIKKRRVNIGDCELYIEEEGKGMPVVLLHGGPGSTHHYFHPHFSQAKDFAQIIYYDQRGCGLSDYKKGSGYTIAQAVDDLENLRNALKIEKWVLLGHSYGGILGQCYTLKYPEKVAGLLLVCSGLAMNIELNPTRQYDYISEEERETMEKHRLVIRRLCQEKKFSKEHAVELILFNNFINGDWKRQYYYRPLKKRIAQIALYEWKHDADFNEIMSQDVDRIRLNGAFERCPIPRLIIEAKWDLTWNTDKPEKFHKNHPNSQLVMFEHSGHSPFEDEPEKFFNVMRKFVQTLPKISDLDLDAWKEYLIGWKKKIEDPFLVREMGENERGAIEEFNTIRKKIREGDKYEDGTTPLHTYLTMFSASRHRDKEAIKRNVAIDLDKMNIELTDNYIAQMGADFNAFDILRAPPPPPNPEEGEFWPIYVKELSSDELKDTFLIVFWKGKWMWFGNLDSAGNWRSELPRLKAILEQVGKK